jgi:nicotinamidase-related amidase
MEPKALILVDFENEWTDESSEYFAGDISGVIERVNRLIDSCREGGYRIIFTRHVEKAQEGPFAEGSEGSRLIPGLHRKESDTVITKHKINPFFRTGLEEELRGIERIVVAGILTNLCVRSLVEDAYDRDLKIAVIKDCCVSLDKETQDFTFRDLKATREEIEFLDLDEFTGQGRNG